MGLSTEELGRELEATAQEVLGKIKSRQLFQSEWDTAAFVVFLVFVGTVLLLLLLVIAHCCCRCCCPSTSSGKEKPRGMDNLALEP
ncbi:PREDICTED: small integral membrane protein 22 [Dipodomys ordii]|uniref:Small integral membrane protein 22 n=1 Tax=Dipodomys ordii TaxID=10020 RepID=A0A1S3ESH7_DIPOR|nr:PREDICTED: small integral membrane protein 22 [Dipodomys ordii]XP_012866883.1 PREDICTED: small integral membrane protein 22 [Dipodomys ordii]XP_012866884.1 PREDICTED: small integral membrane protein 22 [Dipodomys ordii]XP_042554052.1 small integral membrane protein 22 isoform X2 [Dipodomys spectabilis]